YSIYSVIRGFLQAPSPEIQLLPALERKSETSAEPKSSPNKISCETVVPAPSPVHSLRPTSPQPIKKSEASAEPQVHNSSFIIIHLYSAFHY
uniref:Uncharacterized protein n=1 Tax=Periophthalmus magnuspinnatus TaxID=409849 RepID=A0A3B4A7Q6_9GOBI